MISEPIPFMANIVLVAHVNGKLSASELGLLDSIRSELKFKKSDLKAAIRVVEQGNHKVTPVGSFADNVKNLELILRVAYADDDLDESEASLVSDFCKAVGIYPDQLERLRGEVLASLKQQGKICPSCEASAEADARFCPKCGSSFTSVDEVIQIELAIPSSGLAIEFAESTAASFPKALDLAKATEGFQSCQKNKKTWHLAVYRSGDLREALPLVESLSGIRNRRLYIDGKRNHGMRFSALLGAPPNAPQRIDQRNTVTERMKIGLTHGVANRPIWTGLNGQIGFVTVSGRKPASLARRFSGGSIRRGSVMNYPRIYFAFAFVPICRPNCLTLF